MMTAYQLKMSVLNDAMRGILVERDLKDSPVSEFLDSIANEKKALISQKIIKPEKKESIIFRGDDGKFYEQIGKMTTCIQDEIPYDIPGHWEWQRLSTISYNHDSKRKPVSVNDRAKREKLYDYYGATGAIDKVDDYLFDGIYVLTGEDGGNFFTERDNAFIVKGKFWPNNHVHVLQVISGFEGFFCWFLNSLNLGAMGLINGIAVPKLNRAHLNSILVPIPPLAEQKRIVAKIEELMPYVEQYAEASTKLNTLNTTFPDLMKKSILQEAVQGKLVPQDPNDEPASVLLEKIAEEKKRLIKEGKIKKQKPLPEITEDEIPFDIPESWEWVRLGNLCRVVTGRLDANAQDSHGEYPFFTCGEEVFKTLEYAFECDAVLLGGNNAAGIYKMHRYCGKFNAYQRVYVISGRSKCEMDYLYCVIKYWLPSLRVNSQGTTTRFIKLGQVINMLVPLPPIEEQERIVTKLTEVTPLLKLRAVTSKKVDPLFYPSGLSEL